LKPLLRVIWPHVTSFTRFESDLWTCANRRVITATLKGTQVDWWKL
jgi:hypothetical protein